MKTAQAITAYDPLRLGVQLGAAGAAAGLGWAAIHRAVRLRHQNDDPVSVVKPVLVGAMIGATLGVAGSASQWGKQGMATKYAALKTALFDSYSDWSNEHPLASTAGYWLPGVGTVLSGMDAIHDFSHGNIARGIGNTLMMPFGLVSAGGLMKSMPRLAQLARLGRASAAVGPEATSAAKTLVDAHNRMGRFATAWQRPAAAMAEGPLSRMSPQTAGDWWHRGRNLERGMGVQTGVFGGAPKGWRNPSRYNAALYSGLPLTLFGKDHTQQPQVDGPASGSEYGGGGGLFSPTEEPQRYRGLGYVAGLPQNQLPFG